MTEINARYPEVVRAANAEAESGETYAALPGEPTMIVNGTIWYFLGFGESRVWVRDFGPESHGVRICGAYTVDEFEYLLIDSGVWAMLETDPIDGP